LAQADVGIALDSGSDIAAETSGIVLVNSNPKDVVNLILFGKATYRKMIQNLIWATGYNLVALPLAAGVMYRQGILLSPAAGASVDDSEYGGGCSKCKYAESKKLEAWLCHIYPE